jgi:hypothetical protein
MAAHRFGAVLALARKKKTPAEARKSLFEMGIVTETGALAEHYTAKPKSAKTGGKSKTPKTIVKARVAKTHGQIKTS